MYTAKFFSALIIIVAMIFTCDSHSIRPCKPCNDECNECPYGSVFNENCGHDECGKGPRQRCNKRFGFDNCGDGLTCLCGTCHGCSSIQVDEPCHNSICLIDGNYKWLENRNFRV